MNISQRGIDLIKSFEGCRLKAYKPVTTEKKNWTIGYGHYGSDVSHTQTITQEEAENLKKGFAEVLNGVKSPVKVDINQNQFDALVSFAYNCGIGALQKSTLLRYINIKDFNKAAKEFDKWVHGGGKVLPGLVKRCAAESALFERNISIKIDTPKSTHKPKDDEYMYVVYKGDTLSEIANKYEVSTDYLAKKIRLKIKIGFM